MKESNKAAVRQILTKYLDENKLRKTPERFAVLDAVYSFNDHFSIQELSEKIEKVDFVLERLIFSHDSFNFLSCFAGVNVLLAKTPYICKNGVEALQECRRSVARMAWRRCKNGVEAL